MKPKNRFSLLFYLLFHSVVAVSITNCTLTPQLGAVGVQETVSCFLSQNYTQESNITCWLNISSPNSNSSIIFNFTNSTQISSNSTPVQTGQHNYTIFLSENNTVVNNSLQLKVLSAVDFNYIISGNAPPSSVLVGWSTNNTYWSIPQKKVPQTTLDIEFVTDVPDAVVLFPDFNFSSNIYPLFRFSKTNLVLMGEDDILNSIAIITDLSFDKVRIFLKVDDYTNNHLEIWKCPWDFLLNNCTGSWSKVCSNSNGNCGHTNNTLSKTGSYIYVNQTSLSAFAVVVNHFCGDDRCNSDESCSSCPDDCMGWGQVCCDGELHTGECCSSLNCNDDEICTDYKCIKFIEEEEGGAGGGGGGGGGGPPEVTTQPNITLLESLLAELELKINLSDQAFLNISLSSNSSIDQARVLIDQIKNSGNSTQEQFSELQQIIDSYSPIVPNITLTLSEQLDSSEYVLAGNITVHLSRQLDIFELDSTNRSIYTITLTPKTNETFEYVEQIPKEIASSVDEITFIQQPRIINPDPIVAWDIEGGSGPVVIQYLVEKSVPTQLPQVYNKIPDRQELIPTKLLEEFNVSKVSEEEVNNFMVLLFVGALTGTLGAFFVAQLPLPEIKLSSSPSYEGKMTPIYFERGTYGYHLRGKNDMVVVSSKKLSYPVEVTGKVKETDDLMFLKIRSVDFNPKKSNRKRISLLKKSPKSSLKLIGTCEDYKIDLDGYWYKLSDASGEILLFSNKPIKITAKVSGHLTTQDGKKVLKLKGSRLDPKKITKISI